MSLDYGLSNDFHEMRFVDCIFLKKKNNKLYKPYNEVRKIFSG